MATFSVNNASLTGYLELVDELNPTRLNSFKDDFELIDLDVVSGQVVQISLTSESFDTYLQLVNGDTGEVIFENDDFDGTINSQLTFVPETGINYLVRVTSFNSEITGDYTLTSSLIVPPDVDLTVTNATAPTSAIIGDTINVSWTVANLGKDAAEGNFYGYLYDGVYVSDDPIFDANDTYLTDFFVSEYIPLAGGGNYTVNKDIYLSSYVEEGDRYLLFVTDHSNNESETNEDNNTLALPLELTSPDVDLTITSAISPVTAPTGSTIDVSWTVTNLGTDSAKGGFYGSVYDEVYISTDEVFDDTDTYLSGTDTLEYIPLAGGNSYTINNSLVLSNPYYDSYGNQYYENVEPGNYYLLFVSDRYNDQVETNEDNNVAAVEIEVTPVETPAVDLVVTEATAPTTAKIGETINLSWTVSNLGTEVAENFFGGWSDGIYLSEDAIFDYNDIYVSNYQSEESLSLAGGDSYTVVTDVFLNNYIGNQDSVYLLFIADEYQYQSETNENNNTFAVPIDLTIPDVDLVVTDVSAPTSAIIGETINVSWTISNLGSETAKGGFSGDWYNTVYFSQDEKFDFNDYPLTDYWTGENFSLEGGDSYTFESEVYLNNYSVASGGGYLLFFTDSYNYQSETNEDNNTLAVPIELTTPDVDLVVTDANAPVSAPSGSTIDVSWTVKNIGAAPAKGDSGGHFYDNVYISTDEVFDYDDIFLSDWSGIEYTPLAGGDSYSVNTSVNLVGQNFYYYDYVEGQEDIYPPYEPSYYNLPTGDYYLIFTADSYNYQVETNEKNNTFAVPITVTESENENPDVDLVVTDATGPESASVGSTINVSWTVANIGNAAAQGSFYSDWYDGIYVSNDEVFDENDTFVTSQWTGEYVPLATGDSYSFNTDIYLDSYLGTGDRYLIFVADSYNYQTETNEDNNTFAVPISLNNFLTGTSENEILVGDFSSQLNDYIDGDAGDDSLYGREANDRLVGGFGNDFIIGNQGNDTLEGGDGLDTLNGSDEDDNILGGGDSDRIFGAEGNDIISGGDGDDLILGNLGNDSIHGDAGNDLIYDVEGEDSLYGDDGDDYLAGGVGNDYLDGGVGLDTLNGGAGDDTLVGGRLIDVLYGKEGADTFVLQSNKGKDFIMDFEPGVDILGLSDGLTFDQLSFEADLAGTGTLIRNPDGNGIAVLKNIPVGTISESYFL